MISNLLLPPPLVHALGWTLAHSLWQGSVFALALWFFLPRLASSQARYRAAFAALSGVLVAAALTFFWVYQPENEGVETAGVGIFGLEKTPGFSEGQNSGAAGFFGPAETPGFSEGQNSPLAAAAAWLESHHIFIVSVWLLGFVFFLARLVAGLWWVSEMRRRHVFEVPGEWAERFETLREAAGIRRTVALLESGLARTPMVLGYLKPLVLLPIGLLNQLSPAETEAVLAHELAHIARRDWLTNLLQAFIEALFYFHPAVWWLSGIVRAERENCCDDFAIGLSGNRLLYAKALLRVQENAAVFARQNRPAPALALALDGGKNTPANRRPVLLGRIKRILQQPQSKAPLMEKMTASGILLALLAVLGISAQTNAPVLKTLQNMAETPVEWLASAVAATPETEAAPEAPEIFNYQTVTTDTVPGGKKGTRKITSDDGERKVEMTLENNQIKSLVIDGKEIPPADYDKYEDVTDAVLAEVMAPMPPMPAMAPMPPMPPMPAMAPMPPMPALAPEHGAWAFGPARSGGNTSISTSKDGSGNTVINLNRNGRPTEIVVKDGQVFIDGKAVETGKSIDLGGSGSNGADAPNAFFWNGEGGEAFNLEGQNFQFFPEGEGSGLRFFNGNTEGMTDEARAELEAAHAENTERMEDIQADLRARQEEMQDRLRELQNEQKSKQKEWTKEQRERQHQLETELREAQKHARQAMQDSQMELRRAMELQREAMGDERRARAEQHRSESTSDEMLDELVADGLVSDRRNCSFSLSGKSMKVNGKKQPEAVHQKYLEFYREQTGKAMGKSDNISFEISE